MYIQISTNIYPLTEQQIRDMYPHVSFPHFFEPPEDFALVKQSVQPDYNPNTQMVVERVPVLREGSYYQQWEIVELSNEVIDQNLSIRRSDIWNQIKSIRDSKLIQGFKCNGYWFHSDINSKILYLVNKDTARDYELDEEILRDPGSDDAIEWKTMDNKFVTLTKRLAYDIIKELKFFERQIFLNAEKLKSEVYLSENPTSLDINIGWPETYQDHVDNNS